jgi:hypothetical protein
MEPALRPQRQLGLLAQSAFRRQSAMLRAKTVRLCNGCRSGC